MRSDRSHSIRCCLISIFSVKRCFISSKPVSIFSSRSYSIRSWSIRSQLTRICVVKCCCSSRSYSIRSCSVNSTWYEPILWTCSNDNQNSSKDSSITSATISTSCDCKKVEWSRRKMKIASSDQSKNNQQKKINSIRISINI